MPPRAQPRPFAAAIASLLRNPRHSPLLDRGTIWRVAKHDLFGTKDVQDSPTLSYVWLADQFGHFGIGFAGTLAVGGVIAGAFGWSPAWCAFGVGVLLAAWFVYKEWRDYRDEQSHAWSVLSRRPVPFAFNGGEILHNCLCACFYTFCGIVIAVLGIWRWWAGLAAFAVLLLLGARVAFWWLQRKVAFQQADLPYLYRLTNFPENFEPPQGGEPDAEDILHELICGATPKIRHVLIAGPLGSGKTSLAIGIGTEYAFRLGTARFTSVLKLSQTGVAMALGGGVQPRMPRPNKSPDWMPDNTTFQDGRVLWPYDDAELLIVDDLDGGIADAGVIDPKDMLAALRAAPGRQFFAKFANRRTVWIAGAADRAAAWRDVVTQLVATDDPGSVALLHLHEDVKAALDRKR